MVRVLPLSRYGNQGVDGAVQSGRPQHFGSALAASLLGVVNEHDVTSRLPGKGQERLSRSGHLDVGICVVHAHESVQGVDDDQRGLDFVDDLPERIHAVALLQWSNVQIERVGFFGPPVSSVIIGAVRGVLPSPT